MSIRCSGPLKGISVENFVWLMLYWFTKPNHEQLMALLVRIAIAFCSESLSFRLEAYCIPDIEETQPRFTSCSRYNHLVISNLPFVSKSTESKLNREKYVYLLEVKWAHSLKWLNCSSRKRYHQPKWLCVGCSCFFPFHKVKFSGSQHERLKPWTCS